MCCCGCLLALTIETERAAQAACSPAEANEPGAPPRSSDGGSQIFAWLRGALKFSSSRLQMSSRTKSRT